MWRERLQETVGDYHDYFKRGLYKGNTQKINSERKEGPTKPKTGRIQQWYNQQAPKVNTKRSRFSHLKPRRGRLY